MPRWIIQYVYMDADGKTRVSLDTLAAPTRDEARDRAARGAPADEFLVTVQAESDEQYLGTVRHRAMTLAAGRPGAPAPAGPRSIDIAHSVKKLVSAAMVSSGRSSARKWPQSSARPATSVALSRQVASTS